MPIKREAGPDDRKLILRELQTVYPIPLTRLDLTDELGLPYAYTSALLAQMVEDGEVRIKEAEKFTRATLFVAAKEAA